MDDGGGCFGYGISEKDPHFNRPIPPLTAIDRFLWSTKEQTLGSATGFGEFSASGGVVDGYSSGILLPDLLHNISFVDGLFVEGQDCFNMTEERAPKMREVERMGKSMKGGASGYLIKGQWTEEEDRLLVTLVKQYGERKWALVAQKLAGRAGKQCRERWHNHLRPNIKKDTWSEEEERLLVEAHEKVGNKWAEIAKGIPGRTENSIKNHWNATKRRQNSRRKNKRTENQSEKAQLSLLQDYIRRKTMNDNSTTNTESALSIQRLFESIDKQPSEGTVHVGCAEEGAFCDGQLQELLSSDSSLYSCQVKDNQNFIKNEEIGCFSTNPISTNMDNAKSSKEPLEEETSSRSHLWSDLYLAYLLNELNSHSSTLDYYCEYPDMDRMMEDQSPSNGKKEMDLIEMVSSSQFS